MPGKCRGLYNWWVMRLRDGERWPGGAEAKATLEASKQHDPELRLVYGTLLHEVYFRLDKAMTACFRRRQSQTGEKPGVPRVRPRHCFFTLCYPATRPCMSRSQEIGGLCPPVAGGRRASPSALPTSWSDSRSRRPPIIEKEPSRVTHGATTPLHLSRNS